MHAHNDKRFHLLPLLLSAVSLFLVGLGGYVRGTGAGLACPDWPLCFGRMVPRELQPGVFQEVAHRYLAAIVTLGTIAFAVFVYRVKNQFPNLWKLVIFLLSILGIQIILGGLTVLMKLNPFIVTAHLLFGTLFFQALSLPVLEKYFSRPNETLKKKRFFVSALLLLLFLQILLGGFVGSSGAALVCPDIPLCLGEVFPDGGTPAQMLHMVHRLNGVALAILLFFALFTLRPEKNDGNKHFSRHLVLISILVVVQVFVGFASVYLRIPVALAVMHLIIAQLMLLLLLHFFKRYYTSLRFFGS